METLHSPPPVYRGSARIAPGSDIDALRPPTPQEAAKISEQMEDYWQDHKDEVDSRRAAARSDINGRDKELRKGRPGLAQVVPLEGETRSETKKRFRIENENAKASKSPYRASLDEGLRLRKSAADIKAERERIRQRKGDKEAKAYWKKHRKTWLKKTVGGAALAMHGIAAAPEVAGHSLVAAGIRRGGLGGVAIRAAGNIVKGVAAIDHATYENTQTVASLNNRIGFLDRRGKESSERNPDDGSRKYLYTTPRTRQTRRRAR